jgi:arabinosaccharide transport system permease protein
MISNNIKKRLISLALLVLMIAIAVFCLGPLFFLLSSSFKPGSEMIRNGITLKLDIGKMNFDNYKLLWEGKDGIYLYWYRNSVIITFLGTVLSLILSSLVGYGLAMYKFKGRNFLFILILIVMMTPIEILILPLYKLSIAIRFIDTYHGVILPFAVSPFAVFFFRQYASKLSKEFMDAGRIDGCSEFGIYFRIMMPLMLPAFGAMTILQAMSGWNAFVWPLIVLRSNEMLTLPIGLQSLLTPYGNNYDLLLSGVVMSIIPIMIVFWCNQKAFISGLTVGGVKG